MATTAFDKYRNQQKPERGTTTAFDRYKESTRTPLPGEALGAKPYRSVTDELLRDEVPTPGSGLTKYILKKVPKMVTEAAGEYMEKEAKARRDMSIGAQFKQDFFEKPVAIYKFVGQGLAASVLGLGRSLQEQMLSPLVGDKKAREVTKGGSLPNFERFLTGEDRVKSYQEITEEVSDYVNSTNVSTEWERKYLPGTLGIALFALDAWPGKPNLKKSVAEIIETIAKETSEKKIRSELIKNGIEKNIAKNLAPKLVTPNTDDAVRQVIKEEAGDLFQEMAEQSTKTTAQLTKEAAAKVVVEKQAARDTALGATAETATKTSREVVPRTIDLVDRARTAQAAGKTLDDFVAEVAPAKTVYRSGEEVPVTGTADDVIKYEQTELGNTSIVPEEGVDLTAVNAKKTQWVSEAADAVPEGATPVELEPGTYRVVARDGEGRLLIENTDRAQIENAWKTAEAQQPVPVQTGKQPVNTYPDAAPERKVDIPEEEAGAIRDMAARDASSLRPTRATGKVSGRNLAKEMEANINRMNEKIPDAEIVKIREQNLLGPESIDEIILRKRGIISDAEAVERAKNIQGTLEDVINLPKGTVATKEQYTAVRQIVAQEEEINKKLRNLIDNGGVSSSKSERAAIARLGEGYENLPEDELLVRALEESTAKLKQAQIVEMALRSEAGRSLQALKQTVSAVDTRLRVLYRAINNSKKLNAQEKQAMIETVVRLDTTDDKLFLKTLEDLVQPDLFDKYAEWSVAAKLWNPTTHAVNLGGNTARAVADMGIKAVVSPKTAKADFAGAVHGFNLGLKKALKALTDDGYAAQLSKYAETGGHIPAIGGRLGKFVRTPFRFLGAGDEIFRNMAYQRKLYRDAYNTARKEGVRGKQLQRRMEELLNAPSFKMMEDATKEAKRLTFQEDLGEIMKKLDRLRDPQSMKTKYGKAAAVGVRQFLPFLKTPTNLFKQSIDFSPIGLVKNQKRLREAIKAGDRETAGTIIGEAIVGTAIAYYIYNQTVEGNVTGGAPSDAAKKDRFYRENKLPYAIKVGDTWYQYKRVDPFASIIGLTADLTTSDDKNISAMAGIVANNLKDKTYLSGVSDLMKVLTGEEWERDYALKSMLLGGMMPSFIGHTTRSMDSTIRVADTIGQRLLVQTPGMSDIFPARVNVLGYDVKRANKGLNYFFNPIQTASAKIDPVTEELMQIDKTIAVPSDNFKRDGVKYEMTPKEYEDYGRFVGLKLRFELMDLFDSDKYQNASIDEKSAMIDTLRKNIQDEYKDAFVEQKQVEVDEMQQFRNFVQGRPLMAAPEKDAGQQFKEWFTGQ